MTGISRRNFINASAAITATSILLPNNICAKEKAVTYTGGLSTGKPISLAYKSIPGFLSEGQIAPHYSAHYGGALRGYMAADETLQSGIVEGTSLDGSAYGATQRARTHKANSVLLHELYFEGMSAISSKPSEDVINAIEKRFGSIEKWADDFKASASAASGWAVLAYDQPSGHLFNIVSDKHATGVLWMATPLVVIDVYEHAYYVDYKNNKKEYVKKYMDYINWNVVNSRFRNIIEQSHSLQTSKA